MQIECIHQKYVCIVFIEIKDADHIRSGFLNPLVHRL